MKKDSKEETLDKSSLSALSSHFDLGSIRALTLLKGGIVNLSYKAETSKGNFVLQRLSPIFDSRVVYDYLDVERYLRTNSLFVPILLRGKDNIPFCTLDGYVFRAFEYIENDPITNPSPDIAYEGGLSLGRFHSIMSRFNFTPRFSLPHFHDTRYYIKSLTSRFNDPRNYFKADSIRPQYSFILSALKCMDIPSSHDSLIHGDPKLANYLFKDNKAIATLDLDTVMYSDRTYDIGDALRSWCRQKPSTSLFLPEIFESYIEGYNDGSDTPLTRGSAKDALSLLTLELCTRYLIDYFDESYFTLNPKYSSRAEQSITRCTRYLGYYSDFTAQLSSKGSIVRKVSTSDSSIPLLQTL